MYNSADEKFDGTYPTNVVVRSNGSCNYIPPGIFKSTCKINIRWFPFDDQMCQLKFGSWTYAGLQLDLQLNSEDGGDLTTYIPNGEWDLLELPGERNVFNYTCCPEPYIDITYTIKIRRRTLYYGVNLIIPCVLISSMTLLGFTLPPDTGERLTLGVTILLSLTVFMLQLAEALPPVSDAVSIIGITILLSLVVFLLLICEKMPETSDAVPLIGTYFACIMMMVAFSVVMTVLVLNYHHRNKECAEMPKVVRSIFLVWLPWLLRMQVPASLKANLERRQSSPESNASPSFRSSAARRMFKELELKERSSRSLLANVLDLEDDFRPSNAACYLHPPPPPRSQPPAGTGTSFHKPSSSAPSSMANIPRELQTIMVDLRYITDKMRKDEEEHEVVSEWRFAAKVIDRVCFLFFSAFTAISTIACLFSAPHLYA
ncbi:neuronal acetylcholine receptor subunit alpha-7 [Galendromus occidentalis]|uniref:Neuronal acetylcholine receptor subunit alpha-7 n=1 Tax=Galendromus occidentalis TaxID=34638 RepID=A0AAJ7SEC6_9ACAR|nr:neuronal acetylcholine receptor subunit alpha-7 [Galendromus occidentalis]